MTEHWKEVLPVDSYQIMAHGTLQGEAHAALHLLYQPLVGASAISFYQTLLSEYLRCPGRQAIHTHHFLMNMLHVNMSQLFEARRSLEGIGLLKTMRKKLPLNNTSSISFKRLSCPLSFFRTGFLIFFCINVLEKRLTIR
ncbi:hypothetical protein G4V62_08600 [Bacillaceae bacterium SIJ1]|uniref:hypothetical protein n=1 Tax=Litoribacterium kuwaitense TaxID=1398745 RepID=UPI0013EC549B|nr:hypothetical protein [Litoribacterium kuwaitense]NGP45014.1 hypothetical protein [Litoribacterium kuwaitense]